MGKLKKRLPGHKFSHRSLLCLTVKRNAVYLHKVKVAAHGDGSAVLHPCPLRAALRRRPRRTRRRRFGRRGGSRCVCSAAAGGQRLTARWQSLVEVDGVDVAPENKQFVLNFGKELRWAAEEQAEKDAFLFVGRDVRRRTLRLLTSRRRPATATCSGSCARSTPRRPPAPPPPFAVTVGLSPQVFGGAASTVPEHRFRADSGG